MSQERLDEFLARPVPFTGTVEWQEWKRVARAFDDGSYPELIEALENGAEVEQHAALLVLRELGWTAFGEGYGDEFIYRVSGKGSGDLVVRPRVRTTR